MVRRIIAVLAGIAVAIVLVTLIQKLGHSLYPPPADMDPTDREFMQAYVASLPWGPLAFVIGSYLVATLIGGWLAAAIAGDRPLMFSGIVAAFMLAGAIFNVVMIPHPTWFTLAAVGSIVLAALLAASLGSRHGGSRRPV